MDRQDGRANAPRYDDDFYAWCMDQAEKLTRGELDGLDIENIAEEIESMGKRDRREIASRFKRITRHLLKCVYQPQKFSESWHHTIRSQRDELTGVLNDSPSLAAQADKLAGDAYPAAVRAAAAETGMDRSEFPSNLPFTVEELLDDHFLPRPEEPRA